MKTTNTAPTTLSAIQAASNHTPLVFSGNDKNMHAADIIKPTKTRINRVKYTFCIIKSLERLQNKNKKLAPSSL
jgi:hypothetical protein